jgi:phosphoribosylanthranilate isomerase
MNPRTRVKICGITRLEDARHAAAMGADAIGLMLHPPSSRALSLDKALEIRRSLPPFVTATAVFLDDSEDLIAQVLHSVKPDCLQFHGSESAEFCASWGLPYLKAIPMGSIGDPRQYAERFETAQGFLFDSNAAGRLGGSGDTFDWSKIPTSFDHPVVLAGGMNPSNVAEAIARVKPWGVDVSSGVEDSRGIKNAELVERFIEEVRRGDGYGS